MNIRAKVYGDMGEASPLVTTKRPKGAKTDMLHSVPVTREQRQRADTRGGDRHRLASEQVRIRHNGTDCAARLINLSGGGAMVAGDFTPMLWDRVDLLLGESGRVEGAVRWLKGDRVGLEFAHETQLDCPADEQARVLRMAIEQNFGATEMDEPLAAAAEPETAQPLDEQRGDRRHPLIWSGEVHCNYESVPVRLRNISSSGALIEGAANLSAGAEPLLDLGEAGQMFATVTWTAGDQAGLSFRQPFDMSQLARARPEVAPARGTGLLTSSPEQARIRPGPSSGGGCRWASCATSSRDSSSIRRGRR